MRDDITPEDMEKIAVLMQTKGRNSYEYLSHPLTRVCPVCGEVFQAAGRGRHRRFCSKECRLKYHHQHPDPSNWASTRIAVCPVCHKEFQASREYGKPRKYCSRACANKARAMIRRGELREEQEDDA